MNQLKQILATFTATRQADPTFLPMFAAATGITLLLSLVVAFVVGPVFVWLPLGILLALLAGVIVLGRRAQTASIAAIEGKSGAAAAVLQSMRGAWEVTPAVAFNRREDMVHLAVGRPGVVLVAEGSSSVRVKQLLVKERRRFERAAGDIPVTEVLVGDGEGQVGLQQLTTHMAKLKPVMKAKEVGPLHRKLDALGASAPPMPKGPQMRRAPKRYR